MLASVSINRALLLLLVLFSIFLGITNAVVLGQNRHLFQLLRTSNDPPLGVALPPIRGVDLTEHAVVVSYGNGDRRNILLLVVSPQCRACEHNWKNWQRLLEHVDHSKCRTVVVDLSGTIDTSYVSVHGLDGASIIKAVDWQSLLAYNLRATPETIVIGRDGVVKRASTGFMDTPILAAFEKLVSTL